MPKLGDASDMLATHRTAAKFRVKVLLDACEIEVAIDEEGGERSGHGPSDAATGGGRQAESVRMNYLKCQCRIPCRR